MHRPWCPWRWRIRLVTRALLTGVEAVGALVEWVLGVPGVLPVLPLLLPGLGFGLDLWGAFGADFCPGPSVGPPPLDGIAVAVPRPVEKMVVSLTTWRPVS